MYNILYIYGEIVFRLTALFLVPLPPRFKAHRGRAPQSRPPNTLRYRGMSLLICQDLRLITKFPKYFLKGTKYP